MRAPYAGTVVGLAVHSVGGVIGRGERILDIVPDASPMVVEGRVAVGDIADVHPGMTAEVHLTAYKQRVAPMINGTVSEVSATLVASTMRRCGPGWNTRSWSFADSRAYSGSTSVWRYLRFSSAWCASRISRSPGRKTKVSPMPRSFWISSQAATIPSRIERPPSDSPSPCPA